MLSSAVVLGAVMLLAPLLFTQRARNCITWQATITPIASIIGSGFLIAAPLVILTTGSWAPLAMLGVVTVAYLLGSVIRFNILHLEPLLAVGDRSVWVLRLEALSHPVLGVAYVISVAYYLKLLAIFTLQGLSIKDPFLENLLTTAVLGFIGIFGWFRGLEVIEILAKYAVNTKLVVITAMVVGFVFYNAQVWYAGNWVLAQHPHVGAFEVFQRMLGILIIVQGFETSRYLGQTYSAKVRVQSMQIAQIVSGLIYVVFVCASMLLLEDLDKVSETVVIDLCRLVAPILPPLLIVTAMLSQFSAAVADAIGSSGLIAEATRDKLSIKQGIVITVLISTGLIWVSHIYEIVVIASKAFAAYYGIQCVIATGLAYQQRRPLRLLGFAALALLMGLVVTVSKSVE